MNILCHKFLIRLFSFFILLTFYSSGVSQNEVGSKFPEFKNFNLEADNEYDLSGKILLVDFWASWCRPCKDAFPVLNQIQKQYSKNEVLVIGINVDRDKKLMKRFLKKNDCNFLILHDASKDLVSKMDLKTFPTSFVVDSNKIIKSVHTGFNKKTTKKNYIKVINELISKKTTNDK